MIRKYDGRDLAKVLVYYGIIDNVNSSGFNIVCPFHEDINPSMRIDLSDGSFYCFGCEVQGNALDFVQKAVPEVNPLQSTVLLEQIVRSHEVRHIQYKARKKRRINNKQSLIEAHDYYYGLKTVDWKKPETEEEKQILEYMYNRGFDAMALNKAHCKANCNVAYPFVFPILDNGIFKGWVARTMNKHTEKKRKYLYNEGFYKRDTLCGTYEENSIVFLCEGFFDYLALKARGRIKNVVALLGWHISDEQTNKLKQKGVKVVISALDNDKCGERGTEYLKRFFQVVRFEIPDDKKDTGDMTAGEIRRSAKKAIYEARRIMKEGAV